MRTSSYAATSKRARACVWTFFSKISAIFLPPALPVDQSSHT